MGFEPTGMLRPLAFAVQGSTSQSLLGSGAAQRSLISMFNSVGREQGNECQPDVESGARMGAIGSEASASDSTVWPSANRTGEASTRAYMASPLWGTAASPKVC